MNSFKLTAAADFLSETGVKCLSVGRRFRMVQLQLRAHTFLYLSGTLLICGGIAMGASLAHGA